MERKLTQEPKDLGLSSSSSDITRITAFLCKTGILIPIPVVMLMKQRTETHKVHTT